MLVSFKTVIFNCCASGWRLYIGQNSAKVNASVKHWNLINITKNCTLISLFKKKKTQLTCLYSLFGFWIYFEFQWFYAFSSQ